MPWHARCRDGHWCGLSGLRFQGSGTDREIHVLGGLVHGVIQDRLRTKDKLFQYHISQDNMCCICGNAIESQEHFFFDCLFSKRLLAALLHWLGINDRRKNLGQWIRWVRRCYTGTKMRRQVLFAMIPTAVYQIWKARNEAYWLDKVSRIECTVKNIKHTVKQQILFCKSVKWSHRDILPPFFL